MAVLFPSIKPYQTHRWKTESAHTLYVEESGNRHGIPVLFLHGGPGGGCAPYNRQYFDPSVYRIILFDQRGSGRSSPHAEINDNTTDHLLGDIETIRNVLDIEQWLLFGGSWGSTLALVYAQTYPDQVLGLVLRGVFLGRKRDIDWFYQAGASSIFPDRWQNFIKIIPEEERHDLVAAYNKRLSGLDELARMAAAKAWATWEAGCATLVPDDAMINKFINPHNALSLARIECHYMFNRCFIKENQILDNIDRIKHLPAILVHGRYDTICPMEQAHLLNQAWPNSRLEVIPTAGHAATEKPMLSALIGATQDMAQKHI